MAPSLYQHENGSIFWTHLVGNFAVIIYVYITYGLKSIFRPSNHDHRRLIWRHLYVNMKMVKFFWTHLVENFKVIIYVPITYGLQLIFRPLNHDFRSLI